MAVLYRILARAPRDKTPLSRGVELCLIRELRRPIAAPPARRTQTQDGGCSPRLGVGRAHRHGVSDIFSTGPSVSRSP